MQINLILNALSLYTFINLTRFINPYKKLRDNYVSSSHNLTDCGLIKACLNNLQSQNLVPTMVCSFVGVYLQDTTIDLRTTHPYRDPSKLYFEFSFKTCYGKEED